MDIGQWLTILLAAIFLYALVTKVAAWETTVEWLSLLRFPAPVLTATLAVGSEACVVAALALDARVGGVLAVAWLFAATVVLYRARQLGLGCSCFGKAELPTRRVFVRNLGLACAAGVVALLPSPDAGPLTLSVAATMVTAVIAGREWTTFAAS